MEAKEQVDNEKNNEGIIGGYFGLDEYSSAFLKILDEAIDQAHEMLLERFIYICSQKPSSANFMYDNNTMAGYEPELGIYSALRHGTLAVG